MSFHEAFDFHEFFYLVVVGRTGFCFMVNEMRKWKGIDAVYDLTLGYPDRIPQTEKAFFKYSETFGLPKGKFFKSFLFFSTLW